MNFYNIIFSLILISISTAKTVEINIIDNNDTGLNDRLTFSKIDDTISLPDSILNNYSNYDSISIRYKQKIFPCNVDIYEQDKFDYEISNAIFGQFIIKKYGINNSNIKCSELIYIDLNNRKVISNSISYNENFYYAIRSRKYNKSIIFGYSIPDFNYFSSIPIVGYKNFVVSYNLYSKYVDKFLEFYFQNSKYRQFKTNYLFGIGLNQILHEWTRNSKFYVTTGLTIPLNTKFGVETKFIISNPMDNRIDFKMHFNIGLTYGLSFEDFIKLRYILF